MCDASEEKIDKLNKLKRPHVDREWAFFIQGILRTNVIVSL